MKIFILNCGSSSIKYQVLLMPQEEILAQGIIERVGESMSSFKLEYRDNIVQEELPVPNHTVGVDYIIQQLCTPRYNILSSPEEIAAVGHRVVHGAEEFSTSSIITPEVIAQLEKCSSLAPLHNPANLKGIYATIEVLPHTTQCCAFDTAFHQTMEPHAYMYALPYNYYDTYKIRRYGFHGISHQYVSERAAALAGKNYNTSKIIVCHLGNGASISAVKNGKSVDTSMGFTPLEGLIMGTRTGDLDVGAALYIAREENLTPDELNDLFNKKSGLKGLCGYSDMRDIKLNASQGDDKAKLTLQMTYYRIKKYVGAYIAAMGGIDCIAFTGGIGENNPELREFVCEGLEFMGIKYDSQKNFQPKQDEFIISSDDSHTTIAVIATNEELMIARDTYRLIHS